MARTVTLLNSPVPQLSRASSSLSLASSVTEDVRSTAVLVPVVKNKCALAAGAVLKRFVPSMEVKPRDPKANTVADVAQRARLSG